MRSELPRPAAALSGASLMLLSLLGVSLVSGSRAHAQSGAGPAAAARLEWAVPVGADCMSRETFATRVEDRLGRSAFRVEGTPDFSVRVQLEPSGGGWVARIALLDRDGSLLGTRLLTKPGESCHSLDAALPIVVALLVDLHAEGAQVVSSEEGVPWRIGVSVGGAAVLGTLPGLVPGIRLAGWFEPPGALPIEVWALVMPGAEERSDVGGAKLWAFEIGASACMDFGLGARLDLRGCLGADVGRVYATGFGFDVVRDANALLLHGLGSLQVAWQPLPPLGLRLGVSGGVPLSRPELVYDLPDGSQDRLYRVGPYQASVDLSVELSVP